jgi:type II secretory pathway pseudopilin PulG
MLELLVVLALIGVVAAIAFGQVTKTLYRMRLEAATNDIRLLLARATIEMQRRGVVTFVRIGPARTPTVGNTTPSIKLLADTTGDACSDPTNGGGGPFDTLIDSYDIPVTRGGVDVQQIALSTAAKDKILSTNWSNNTAPYTAGRELMCDFQGRTIDTTTGLQLGATATFALTHTRMLDGSLNPRKNFQVRINPVFNVSVAPPVFY